MFSRFNWFICQLLGHKWGQQISNNFDWGYEISEEEKQEFCHRCFINKGIKKMNKEGE